MVIKTIAIIGLLIMVKQSIWAQTGEDYFIDTLVNTQSVRIGESFRLVITAGAKQGMVRLPGEHIVIHGCHLINYKEKDVSHRHEGYLACQGIYDLKAFVLDQVHVPALPVMIKWDQGNSITAFTRPVNIAIISMNPEKGLRLINPRSPLQLPMPWLMMSIMVLVLICSFALLFFTRPKKVKEQPAIPAHIAAMKALNMLGQSTVVAEGEIEEYFIILSKLIRRYLAQRYQIPALELSRTAIIYALEKRGVEAKRRELIEQLLKETDMIKFALEPVTEKQISHAHGMAREIIELTKVTTIESKKDV